MQLLYNEIMGFKLKFWGGCFWTWYKARVYKKNENRQLVKIIVFFFNII